MRAYAFTFESSVRDAARGKKIGIVTRVVGAMLLCFLATGGSAKAQAKPAPGSNQQSQEQLQENDQQFQQLIHSVEGVDLYRAYCASCHGFDAKGHGPAAAALKEKVPALTILAAMNGGQFPEAKVRRTIMGDDALASHGSRLMPIWGPIFHQIEADVDRGNVRLENLVKYLESIQTIPLPQKKPAGAASSTAVPSGAELYKQDCAACHGDDLKGAGPAPYPYRTPPDLTTLAERHGGRFPDAYVSDVLRNGVKLPAHGPAQMPIWGSDFKARDQLDQVQVTAQIAALSTYIKSLQAR